MSLFTPSAVKSSLVTVSLALSAFSLNAHATLTSIISDNKALVYSSVSDVTWTKDANLLGSLFASQGFNTVVTDIIAASSGKTYGTTPYTLSSADFNNSGRTSWWGAMAYVNYLNSISYGGVSNWYLPTVVTATSTRLDPSNGIVTNASAKGGELAELHYQELNGRTGFNFPVTSNFVNVQENYWSGTELTAQNPLFAKYFSAGQEFAERKGQLIPFAWAVSPGKIAAVPEPESVAMLLLGLGVLGGVVRRKQTV